jgi:hypothetical protein
VYSAEERQYYIQYLNLKGLSAISGKTFLFSVPVKSTDDLADNQEAASTAGWESRGRAERKKHAGSWPTGPLFKLNTKII